jgi:hypothetical protein
LETKEIIDITEKKSASLTLYFNYGSPGDIFIMLLKKHKHLKKKAANESVLCTSFIRQFRNQL